MKNFNFAILIFGVAIVSMASSLLIVGCITLYYANLGRNALDLIVLSQSQIDQLNFAYYIGMTELITALVLEALGAVLLITRKFLSHANEDLAVNNGILSK